MSEPIQRVWMRSLYALIAINLCFTYTPLVPAKELPRRPSEVVTAVRKARPAVVNIHGQKTVNRERGEREGTRRVNGMGTGVIVDPRGYIITNHHVVDGVRQIRVTLANKRETVARLVAHDLPTDLAIIKIPSDNPLPTITIGRSDALEPGETVVAVGNAYGYEHTVTKLSLIHI